MGRTYPEERLQAACIEWLALEHPRLLPFLHHSPNEGKRGWAAQRAIKRLGVSPGFPDLTVYRKSGRWAGLAVEAKTGHNTPTAETGRWLRLLAAEGWATGWFRTLEQFQRIVGIYLEGR